MRIIIILDPIVYFLTTFEPPALTEEDFSIRKICVGGNMPTTNLRAVRDPMRGRKKSAKTFPAPATPHWKR